MASSSSFVYELGLQRNRELLERLPEPKQLYKALLWCSEVPRRSHHLEQFRERLTSLGNYLERVGSVDVDSVGNVVFRVNGIGKGEGRDDLVTCLQAHQDMVCSANADTEFNFAVQPIDVGLSEDGTTLKAKGTTLGADNAIGIAGAIALLLDETIVDCPPLEILLTVDEETTMGGAENLPGAPFLRSKYLFNLDSEEHGAVCVGCAGGFETRVSVPVARDEVDEQQQQQRRQLDVTVSGLFGGHTGCDIARGRAAAPKLIARLLQVAAAAAQSLRVVALSSGSVINTIPREGTVRLQVSGGADGAAALRALLETKFAQIVATYAPIETTLAIDVADVAEPASALDAESTRRLIDALDLHEHGPIKFNAHNLAEVDTSISLSIVELGDASLTLHSFCRSFSQAHSDQVHRRLASLARAVNGSASEPFNAFPGWVPNMTSKALAAVKQVATRVYGFEPRIYSVHAGLEVGFFCAKYPDMHCVSFGPDIHDAHTPDESLDCTTVMPYYELLRDSLSLLTQE
jgi:dipeptidase D